MIYWRASAALGALLTLRFRPLCAWVGMMPDSRGRRAYCRAMERLFREPRHVERITFAFLLGDLLRRASLPPEGHA